MFSPKKPTYKPKNVFGKETKEYGKETFILSEIMARNQTQLTVAIRNFSTARVLRNKNLESEKQKAHPSSPSNTWQEGINIAPS